MTQCKYRLGIFAATMALLLGIGARAAELVDYGKPGLLTGIVCETGSGTNKVLFTSTRTALRSNTVVQVTGDYLYPNGNIAAREVSTYERGQLVSFQLEDRQTGARGTVTARNNTLFFEWVEGQGASAKKKTDSEKLQPNTLVGDMIPYFIVAHWDELARGTAVNFRYIVESRLETVGFKLVKEAEVDWHGTPAIRFRMEPSSFLIAQLVDPLFFIVEKSAGHRILEYVGRTTPRLRDGSKWKDLDARTVYHWK